MNEKRQIGRGINILSHKIKRRVGKVSLEYGISSMQAKILIFVFQESSKREIFQRDIEEEFDIRRSSVTSVLTLMEKNELINRVSVSEDARLKKLILTDKGVYIYKSIFKEIEEIESIISESLSAEEFDLLWGLIQRLIKKIVD